MTRRPATQVFDLTGKAVLVTGAASGLGEAISEAVARRGARLSLIDINAEGIQAVAQRLRGEGVEVSVHPCDVSSREALRSAIDDATECQGGLDVVFANAGIGAGPGFCNPDGSANVTGQVDNLEDDLWDRVLAVNLTAAFTTVQRAAKHMKNRGKGGRIVVTTSIASSRPTPWIGLPYFPSKAGTAHMVRQLALELAPHNITVNAIAPGAFATNIGGGRLKQENVARAMAAGIPLGRVAEPEEVGGLAVFLASEASAYITGVEIPIDGGSSLGGTRATAAVAPQGRTNVDS